MGIIYSGNGGGVPRKTAHIFAKNASVDDVTIFGSTLAGDTQKSTDLDDIQSEAYEIGWRDAVISNKNYPLLSDMNGVMLTFSQQIAYLLQHGSCGWDKDTEYYTYDLVNVDGIIYVCTIDENVGNPPSELNGWAVFYNPDTMANIDLSNLSEIGESKLNKLPQFCINSGSVDADGNGNCLTFADSTTIITRNFKQPILSADGTMGGDFFAVSANGYSTAYNYYAYLAFDDNNNTFWQYDHAPTATNYIIFYNPVELNVTELDITVYGWTNSIGTYNDNINIYGSNNNSTWTQLASNIPSGAYSYYQYQNVNIDLSSNTNSYKYYKIENTASAYSQIFGYGWAIANVDITATYEQETSSGVILNGLTTPITMTNGYNTVLKVNDNIPLDMSTGYTDGTYNVYASITDGSLSAYNAPLYIQKSEPLGENIATATNAITSGDYSGQPKANAFDGNLSTFWGSAQVGSSAIDGVSYIGNSGLTQPVKQVRLFQSYENKPGGASAQSEDYCSEIKFQYSNDGTNWIDLNTITDGTYAQWQVWDVDDYTPTGATHSFRLLAITKIGGTSSYNWIVGELQLLTDTEANTVWLDKSVRPLKAYKYNDGWQEFTGVPVGTATVSSNAVIDCETRPYNRTEKLLVSDMPSAKYIDLTLGASSSTYTAPADGWVQLTKVSTSSSQWGQLVGVFQTQAITPSSGQQVDIYLPVYKGSSFTVNYTLGGATLIFRFYYAESEV